jgi:polypeptide N-acetylgalactosaminyltransferase
MMNYGETIQLHACTHQHGNQYFRYDLHTQQIRAGPDETSCLEADESNGKISVTSCNGQEVKQKWKWGHMNEANLNNWDALGAPIKK